MTATNEPIEKTRIPGVPDKALVKASNLADANTRVSWMLSDEGSKMTQLLFVESGMVFEATNNTLLVASLIDAIDKKQFYIEELQSQIESLKSEGKAND